jgi:hypothetical protein
LKRRKVVGLLIAGVLAVTLGAAVGGHAYASGGSRAVAATNGDLHVGPNGG